MLLVWRRVVRLQERECLNDVRTCACRESVDGFNKALVHLGLAFQVGGTRRGRRNGVDGHARTVRHHGQRSIHLVDAKSVRQILPEGSLTRVHREIPIVAPLSHESHSKKPVNVSQKIDGAGALKLAAEQRLLRRVSQVEHEIIYVDAHVHLPSVCRHSRVVRVGVDVTIGAWVVCKRRKSNQSDKASP